MFQLLTNSGHKLADLTLTLTILYLCSRAILFEDINSFFLIGRKMNYNTDHNRSIIQIIFPTFFFTSTININHKKVH